MNCCDDYGNCIQGPECPIRKEKVLTDPFKAYVVSNASDTIIMDPINRAENLTLLELVYDAGYNQGRASVMQEQLKLLETT